MVVWLIRERCPDVATFRYPLTTNPDQLNPAWQVTQRIRNVYMELQQQIDMDPPEVYKSGIIGRPVPLFELPLLGTLGPHQKVGWRKFENPSQPYPVLTTVFPHRSYTGKQTSKVSLPLHLKSDQPDPTS